jgi:predicted RNA polymerase sigma factor
MPGRPTKVTTGSTPATAQRRSFRQQYDDLEARRTELCERLHTLGYRAEAHPAYKGALKLLNNIYRKEKLAQRLAVLQSAAWLIDILEKLANTL